MQAPDCQQNWEHLTKPAPHARVSRSNAQAIVTATVTAITFDTVEFDQGATPKHWVVGSPTRLTCQRAGCYLISGSSEWASSGVGANRAVFVRFNGATILNGDGKASVAGNNLSGQATAIYRLAAGEYVELVVYQDSGGNLNTAGGFLLPNLAMAWVSP